MQLYCAIFKRGMKYIFGHHFYCDPSEIILKDYSELFKQNMIIIIDLDKFERSK